MQTIWKRRDNSSWSRRDPNRILFVYALDIITPKFMRTQICEYLYVTQSLHRCRLYPNCSGFLAGMQASRRSWRSASMQKRRELLDAGWNRRRQRCRDFNSPPGRSRYIYNGEVVEMKNDNPSPRSSFNASESLSTVSLHLQQQALTIQSRWRP
jgi:hypothetical protein